MRGLCGLGLNFPTFCLSPSARQKQTNGGSLKDATACRQRLEPISFLCGPIRDPWALGQGFTYCHEAGVEELVATFFSVQDDWFWKILWAPFVGFPSRKPEPSSNWEKSILKEPKGMAKNVWRKKLSLSFFSQSPGVDWCFCQFCFLPLPCLGLFQSCGRLSGIQGLVPGSVRCVGRPALGGGCTVQPLGSPNLWRRERPAPGKNGD